MCGPAGPRCQQAGSGLRGGRSSSGPVTIRAGPGRSPGSAQRGRCGWPPSVPGSPGPTPTAAPGRSNTCLGAHGKRARLSATSGLQARPAAKQECPGERAEGRVVVARVPSECPGLPDETSPPQVSTIEGVSRPVGRVLCARSRGPAVIHLGLPLPAASCGLPASIGRAALDRSRRERRSPLDLAPGGVYRAAAVTCGAGGLLHHRFTLAPAAAEAVCFLWHCPAGRPGSALPTTLPCGARTFLTGLAPGATARPTHPQLRIRAPPGQPTEPVPPRIGHPLVLRDFFLPNGR